ncbi:hypothetical protein E2542_SST26523 [Spatholobus suberectus]|nr:hypothetical protein E2542_SST26523 [Spatholobus suberectus]
MASFLSDLESFFNLFGNSLMLKVQLSSFFQCWRLGEGLECASLAWIVVLLRSASFIARSIFDLDFCSNCVCSFSTDPVSGYGSGFGSGTDLCSLCNFGSSILGC